MGRKRGRNPQHVNKVKKVKETKSVVSDEEDFSDVDMNDESVYNDDIDRFHNQKEKVMLEQGAAWQGSTDDETEEEELFPLQLSDSDSDDKEEDADGREVDMASDLEDQEADGLPDPKAWGKKKSLYYATDYVDEDYGGFEGSDAEAAEAEEQEALILQRKLLEQMDDDDFGLDLLQKPRKDVTDEAEPETKVQQDLSSMSKKEKMELLKKESPELLGLIADFKEKMVEATTRLAKIIPLITSGKVPDGPGANYVTTKYHLILNYCMNILFYMSLKAKHAPVQNHPLIKRLVNFRNLLKQLEPVDKIIQPEINVILNQLEETGEYEPIVIKERVTKKKAEKMRKAVQFSIVDTNDDLDELPPDDDEAGEADVLEKRGINYQIAKNKGLTPRRKKEQRNPRVKHRVKFRKAKIRRKGQVREARKELSRYGGEISGIKTHLTKSIKLH